MGGAVCSLAKPDRSTSGSEMPQDQENREDREDRELDFTEDSDSDSDSDSITYSVYSEDEFESITEPPHQEVLGTYETTEKRVDGLIQVHARSPSADRVQDFWTMIIERRIPTILMKSNQWSTAQTPGQYVPHSSESYLRCGEYTVERIGHISALSLTLFRELLIVYRTDGSSDFKHNVVHFCSPSPDDDYETVAHQASRMVNPQILIHGGEVDGISDE